MNNREYNYLFKIVIVGNSNVGKSSIVLRFADGEFNQTYITTIGVDFRFKSIDVNGKKVKLQIWDTAGQERFRTITSSYYKGAHALFITFDITCKESFNDAIKYWYSQIKNYCPPQTDIILIGNKSDLEQRREVTKQMVQSFTKPANIQYIETSAKESENIEAAFVRISQMLIKREDLRNEQQKIKSKKKSKKQNTQGSTPSSNTPIAINQNETKKIKTCC